MLCPLEGVCEWTGGNKQKRLSLDGRIYFACYICKPCLLSVLGASELNPIIRGPATNVSRMSTRLYPEKSRANSCGLERSWIVF